MKPPTYSLSAALRSFLFVRPILLLSSVALLACESSPTLGENREDGAASLGDGDGDHGGDGDGGIMIGGANGLPTGDGDGDQAAAVCGNGQLEIGELCDDGNTSNDDGCEGDCQSQDPHYYCATPGEPCVNTVICGNGILEGDEVCDDGNEQNNDGCARRCDAIEEGYECARPGVACVQRAVCGNGERERGEQCDDGEATPDDGDGCTSTCQLEAGFFCAVPGEACVQIVCGDGNRTPDEECDDGPGTLGSPGTPAAGDGCSETCTVEPGYRCSGSGCSAECGDGLVVGSEDCDDGNRTSGDGCSAACLTEPFFSCAGEPSNCTSTISCGNNLVEPGEICDPPNAGTGCLAGCKSFSPTAGGGATCGNAIIEAGEECDNTTFPNGCTAGCLEETGWSCPRPNVCFRDPFCGDGILHSPLGEVCDDGNNNNGDGCDNSCSPNMGYTCYGLQPSVCIQENCGDTIRTPGEECEDNNAVNGDGCTGCMIDSGWSCPVPGQACVEKCGDGVKIGDEECDDGNTVSIPADGCNAGCRIDPKWNCTGSGPGSCARAVCGDNVKDPLEGCDDGNVIGGDGCGPTCQNEPVITPGPNPTVSVSCGDGVITVVNSVLEECDDGNQVSGDGCSATCTLEPSYDCTEQVAFPEPDASDGKIRVRLSVRYRDFKNRTAAGGHPDFQWVSNPSTRNMPGPVCTSATTQCMAGAGVDCPTGTCGHLDSQGKPVHHLTGDDAARGRVTSAASFALWYRNNNTTVMDSTGSNLVDMWNVQDVLTLTQVGGVTSEVFEYDSGDPLQAPHPDGHYPINDRGFGNYSGGKNYHFTTELRYFFQYQGGETLTFRGDDDVWVFVNGRHAVDIGGVHGAQNGRVLLGDDGDGGGTDSNCSSHAGSLPTCSLEAGEVTGIADDKRFGLVAGRIYEIVLFHAERHTSASNFKLTLEGFLPTRTVCTPTCGDGVVMPGEVCDDGASGNGNTDNGEPMDDETGECNETCTQRAFCGDGQLNIGEDCDNGTNLDLYLTSSDPSACAPGCVLPPTCGDSVVQAAYESCDNGPANNDSSYGSASCTTDCGLGAYCGDGAINGSEACDRGANNGVEYGPDSCGYDCLPGPFCGDNVRNGAEECDGGPNCNVNCTYDPFCGDGVKSVGEQCDWGQFPSSEYGGCSGTCTLGPYCGDGAVADGFEECDNGAANNNTLYGGCSTACVFGPRCGDAKVQAGAGEVCDNGFNDDLYRFNANSCGAACLPPPSCGDGTVQAAYEQCDLGKKNSDSKYNGCTTKCEWGPYCGDGVRDASEACDAGSENTAYSAAGEACGYDCQPSPYCGDGVRNGPEQCDEGTNKNTGGYGKCKVDCTRGPYCGDGIVQTAQGEDCDAGQTGSLDCTPLCRARAVVK